MGKYSFIHSLRKYLMSQLPAEFHGYSREQSRQSPQVLRSSPSSGGDSQLVINE